MADRRISDFPTLEHALDTDLILVDSSGGTYNISFATLKTDSKGDPGTGISTYTDYYARTNSTTVPSDSLFDTTVKSPTSAEKYVWQYTLITYTNGTSVRTNKHIISVYGDKGVSVTNITTYFAKSEYKTGITITSINEWDTEMPELTEEEPYLWSYQRLTLSEGNPIYTTPGVIGSLGQPGPQGESAYSIAVEHGYEGTEAEWEQDMANAGMNASLASQKAQEAAASASNAASAAQTAVNTALTNYYTKTNVDNLLSNKADTSAVPTKVSDLTNDSGFIANGTSNAVTLNGSTTFNGGISGVTNYVSGEQATGGTWIDGKPIYRYVVVATLTNSTGAQTLADIGSSVDSIIHVYGSFTNSAWQAPRSLPFSGGNSATSYVDPYLTKAGMLRVDVGTSLDKTNTYTVVAEYTKA